MFMLGMNSLKRIVNLEYSAWLSIYTEIASELYDSNVSTYTEIIYDSNV